MNSVSRIKEWMFSAPEGERSAASIILWWEARRLPYNLIVGTIGFCSLLVFYFIVTKTNAIRPGEDAVEPIGLLAAPFIMNLCYTAGWVVEAFWGKKRLDAEQVRGPNLLKLGIKFSLFLVLLPTAYWALYWLLQKISSLH